MINVEDYIEIEPSEYEKEFSFPEELDEDVKYEVFTWLFHPASRNTRNIIRLVNKFFEKKAKRPYLKLVEYINFYFLINEKFKEEEANIIRCIDDIQAEIEKRENEIEQLGSQRDELEEENSKYEDDIVELEDKMSESEDEDEIDDLEYDIKNIQSVIASNNKEIEEIESRAESLDQEIDELNSDKGHAEDFLNELQRWDMPL